jgi:hypothetical protein
VGITQFTLDRHVISDGAAVQQHAHGLSRYAEMAGESVNTQAARLDHLLAQPNSRVDGKER